MMFVNQFFYGLVYFKHGVADVYRMTTFCVTYVSFLVELLLVFFPEPKPLSVRFSEVSYM